MKNRFKKTKFFDSYVYRPSILKFNRKSRKEKESFKELLAEYLAEIPENKSGEFLPRRKQEN